MWCMLPHLIGWALFLFQIIWSPFLTQANGYDITFRPHINIWRQQSPKKLNRSQCMPFNGTFHPSYAHIVLQMCSLFVMGRASKFTVTPSTLSGWGSSVPITMLSLALWVKIHALNILHCLVHFYSMGMGLKDQRNVNK